MFLRHSDSFFGTYTSIGLIFGVGRFKINVPWGHSILREQMLQTHWVIKKPLEQSEPHLKFVRISMALVVLPLSSTFGPKDSLALWRPSRWWVSGGQHSAPIWELNKPELFAYYLPQTNQLFRGLIWNIISFPPLSAPTFLKKSLSQPGLRANSSLVRWKGHRADSRISDIINFRLTVIGNFLPLFPLFPPRTGFSATCGDNVFLLGLLKTAWWMKLTCQSCLDVIDEKNSHWRFWREKAGERDIFPSRACAQRQEACEPFSLETR